jgi:hypothetical protein
VIVVTWREVAEQLSRDIICAILGGHFWDTENEQFMDWLNVNPDYFPKRECLVCHTVEDNPLYRRNKSDCKPKSGREAQEG